MEVKKVLVDTFFGPPEKGVYSPSVQATLYDMAKAVLGRFSHCFHTLAHRKFMFFLNLYLLDTQTI